MPRKSRGPSEASVESYLVDRVKDAGGVVRKLEASFNAHWPDRLVILPGVMALVELKRPRGGRLSEGQAELHRRIRDMGHPVWVLWSRAEVDEFMEKAGCRVA